MNLQRYQNHFFIIPAILVVVSFVAVGLWGLQVGIDLRGGSLLEVRYTDAVPQIGAIESATEPLGIGEVRIQPSGEREYTLRQKALTPEEKSALDAALESLGATEEVQYTSIGPSIGSELVRKAWWAIGLVIISTILYIAFAFRGVSRTESERAAAPAVRSWMYGIVAIITLVHDIIIPLGLYAFLGQFYGAEVGALFIVALLTILGISINDTIVIFDRIRENLARNAAAKRTEEFADVVWRSVSQTIARSFNTSFTVVMVLLALVFFGPESVRELAITLTVGMIAGTYSSIFLASPLLIVIANWQKKRSSARAA